MPISTQQNHHHHRPPRKLLIFFLKCVIMVVIISIFLFFLGFAAIVLIHFLFMSKTFHRRCTRLLRPTNAAGLPNNDAPALVLLPELVYMASDHSDCAICLNCFREGDRCRSLPACGHLFHAKCVDRWIRRMPTCPVCRTRVDLDPAGLMGEGTGGGDEWKRPWSVSFEEGTSY